MADSRRDSSVTIEDRNPSDDLNSGWPLLAVFARLLLAVFAQALVALLFFGATPSAFISAGSWWPVYGILIDAGCFLLITWRIRHEGLRFRDLINFDSHRLRRDVLLGFAYILWVFPLATLGILGFSALIFGNPQPPSVYGSLPVWAAIYSLLVFPVLWGVMEQATYQGYALPRLASRFNSRALAAGIVTFGWALQHIALPVTFDLRFMLYRFLAFLPLALVMTLVYLRTRRLIPFIVAHWFVDMIGILTGIILPMLRR